VVARPQIVFPVLSDLARNASRAMETSAVSEKVFSMAGHIANSGRANLMRSSVNDILFLNSTLKAKQEVFKVDQRFHIFSLQCFFSRAFVGFEMNRYVNCHQRWNELDEFLVDFTFRHTVQFWTKKVRGCTGCGFSRCAGQGARGAWGRGRLDVCRCGAGLNYAGARRKQKKL